jgi:hypothetical protein
MEFALFLTIGMLAGVIYTASCRSNQREIVSVEIKQYERQLNNPHNDYHKELYRLQIDYLERVYVKINGWDSLNVIYSKVDRSRLNKWMDS